MTFLCNPRLSPLPNEILQHSSEELRVSGTWSWHCWLFRHLRQKMVLLLKGKTLTLNNQKQNFSTGFGLFTGRTTNFYSFSYYFCHKSIELDCRTPRGRQRAFGTARRRSQRRSQRIFAVSEGCMYLTALCSPRFASQCSGRAGRRWRPTEACGGQCRPSRSTGPRRAAGCIWAFFTRCQRPCALPGPLPNEYQFYFRKQACLQMRNVSVVKPQN